MAALETLRLFDDPLAGPSTEAAEAQELRAATDDASYLAELADTFDDEGGAEEATDAFEVPPPPPSWDEDPPEWTSDLEVEVEVEVGDIPERLRAGLNPAQEAAVQALDGPVLVVAGPGSGKTMVLTHRVAALLATRRAKPWQVLAVTFTNKAAGEMRERIDALVDSDASDMWVSTFHSACVRILRANALAAGLPRSFSIVDASDAKRLIASCMADLAGGNAPEAADVRQAQSAISAAKNSGMTAEDLAAARYSSRAWVAPIMTEYNRRLRAMGAVDFDDILSFALVLLETNEQVLERYARRFRYVLVDEFQDTNAVQFRIVQLLASKWGNLCVVGDQDQGIYSFRAATPQIMETFVEHWPDTTVVVLEQNYRSTKAILDVVRAIIEPNPAPHRPKLFTTNPDGAPVRLYVADDDRDEASWVVTQIRRSPDGADSHAVLVRTNAQTRSFEEELTRSGIAYSVVGALRFYDRAEVKTALAYLRCALNPADGISLARCINNPKRGIGDATVQKLLSNAAAAGVDPITASRACAATQAFPKRTTAALSAFLELYDEVVTACADGPAAALEVVADLGGMRAMLEANKDGVDRAENLEELISSAESFLRGPVPTRPDLGSIGELPGSEQTLAYLENVALVSSADEGDEQDAPRGRVLLLTAHASKGKEFPHVYVCGVEAGLFPHSRTEGSPTEEAEERRLLFVACSRAETTLTITRACQRMTFGKIAEQRPSPFLEDLPDSVVVTTAPLRAGVSSWAQRPVGTYQQRPGARPAGNGGRWAPSRSAGGALPQMQSHAPRPVAPAGPRLDPALATVGAKVVHTVFGPGQIVRAVGKTAEVAFATGRKTLDLTVAPMALAS